MEDKKIVIVTGATGTIGKALCFWLQEKYRFVVFSRDTEKARTIVPDALAYVSWNPLTDDPPKDELNRAFAIVHLSSAPAWSNKPGPLVL